MREWSSKGAPRDSNGRTVGEWMPLLSKTRAIIVSIQEIIDDYVTIGEAYEAFGDKLIPRMCVSDCEALFEAQRGVPPSQSLEPWSAPLADGRAANNMYQSMFRRDRLLNDDGSPNAKIRIFKIQLVCTLWVHHSELNPMPV